MISCCSLVCRCVKWLGNDIAVYTCIPGAPQACPRIGDTHVSVSLKTATILSTVHRLFLRVQIEVVHSLQHTVLFFWELALCHSPCVCVCVRVCPSLRSCSALYYSFWYSCRQCRVPILLVCAHIVCCLYMNARYSRLKLNHWLVRPEILRGGSIFR